VGCGGSRVGVWSLVSALTNGLGVGFRVWVIHSRSEVWGVRVYCLGVRGLGSGV